MNVLLTHLEEKDSVIKGYMLKSEDSYAKMDVLRLKITQIHGKVRK